ARDAQALAHAVRVAADAVLGAVAELDELEHLVDPAPRLAAVIVRQQLEVLPAGQVRIEPRAFDEAGDTFERLRALDERVASEESCRSRRWTDQAEQDAQQRRLPGSVRPEVAEDV